MLRNHLEAHGIPSMVYYPVPLHLQEAFMTPRFGVGDFPISEDLSSRVLSLPMHTEMSNEQLQFIVEAIISFK
jgi:dTDP-4-amino-4,6-dideoxygalactose transaminase